MTPEAREEREEHSVVELSLLTLPILPHPSSSDVEVGEGTGRKDSSSVPIQPFAVGGIFFSG